MSKGARVPHSAEQQAVKHLRVQTSAYGNAIPVCYGLNRIAGNIVWAGFFRAHRHNTPIPNAAKAGGRVGAMSFTYTSSVIICLAEAPLLAVSDGVTYLGPATPGGDVVVTDANGDQRTEVQHAIFPGVWKAKRVVRAGENPPGPVGGAGLSGWGPIGLIFPTTTQFVMPVGSDPADGFSGHPNQQDELHISAQARYFGFAVVVGADIDLGSNANVPNFNFPLSTWAATRDPFSAEDQNPALILFDILTNPSYGVGLPSSVIPGTPSSLAAGIPDGRAQCFSTNGWLFGLNSWGRYCYATGTLLSPVYDAQQDASAVLDDLARLSNAAPVFSEGLLKMIPYGDVAIPVGTIGQLPYDPASTDNAYGASTANRADLTDDDFLDRGQDKDLVSMDRPPTTEMFNHIRVEFSNREHAYADDLAEATDEAHAAAFGPLPQDPQKWHAITTSQVARDTAQRLLQRSTAVRSVYKFDLGWRFLLLEPCDIVTITDAALGLDHHPVRIVSIAENEEGTLSIEAEDYLQAVGHAVSYQHQGPEGPAVDFNRPASPTLWATVFEPPAPIAASSELWVAGIGDLSEWGGASVYFSEDGDTFALVGVIHGAVMGPLATPLPTSTSEDEETGDPVDALIVEGGQLASTDRAGAKNLLFNLAYVGNGGNNYELIATSLVSFLNAYGVVNVYEFTGYRRRGAYHTAIRAHLAGELYLLLDDSVLRLTLDPRLIGTTVYLKLVPFNPYGAGALSLEDVDVIPRRIDGVWATSPLPDVQNLQLTFTDGQLTLTWDRIAADPRPIDYEVRRGPSWETGQLVGRTTELRLVVQANDTYWIKAHASTATGTGVVHAYSVHATGLLVAGGPLPRNVVLTFDEAAQGWPGTVSPIDDFMLDRMPAAYWPLASSGEDWSGHGLDLTPSGAAVFRRLTLAVGDPLGSCFFNSQTLDSDTTPDVLDSIDDLFTIVLLLTRGASHGSPERWIYDARTSGSQTAPSIAFSAADALRLYRGTSLILEGGSITDTDIHTVIVRSAQDVGDNDVTLWVDGVLVDSDTVPSWTKHRKVRLGGKFDGSGTNHNGYMQKVGVFNYAWTDADIAAFDAAVRATQGGCAVDAATNTLRLTGTTAFNDLADVNSAPSIWFAGGVAARGRYYLPPKEGLTLRTKRPVQVSADFSVNGFAPYVLVADVPVIDDLAAFDGEAGGAVAMRLEGAIGPKPTGTNPVTNTFGQNPFRPLVPREYHATSYRLRATLESSDATLAAEATALSVSLDVDDLQQSAQNVPVGVGIAADLGVQELPAGPTGTVVFSLLTSVSVGQHIIVVAASENGHPPGNTLDVGASIVDGGGNTYALHYATAITQGVPNVFADRAPSILVAAAKITAGLSVGDTITLTIPEAQAGDLIAHAFIVDGLAASSWFDGAALYVNTQTQEGGAAGTYFLAAGSASAPSSGLVPTTDATLLLAIYAAPLKFPLPENTIARFGGDFYSTDTLSHLAMVGIGDDVADPGGLFPFHLSWALTTSTEGHIALTKVGAGAQPLVFTGLLVGFKVAAVDGTVIRFPMAFNSDAPVVDVSVLDAQPGDTVQITDITATGFTVTIEDSAPTPAARRLGYVAIGY